MKHKVIITPRAEHDLDEIYVYIAAESPETALRWYLGILAAIESLSDFPLRCPLAPESHEMVFELRHLIHGNYRIIFGIHEGEVRIAQVRDGRRRTASIEDLSN
jgi:toxin ParE1/3/4